MNAIHKKLHYLSTHRGTKENDILLGRFVEKGLPFLSDDEVRLYSQFLEEPDPEIYDWLMGKTPGPEEYRELIESIKQVAKEV